MNKFKERINTRINLGGQWLPAFILVCVSLVIGAMFIRNIGSFSGPDLHVAHYRSALALASGQIFEKSVPQGHGRHSIIVGNEKYLASGLSCVNNSLVTNLIDAPLVSDGKNNCIREADKALSATKDIEAYVTIQYPFLGYVPQASALLIGKTAGLEPIDAQVLARFFNLTMYILVIVIAIFIIPKGRWLMVSIALLPTSLFLASSLSADALNIAWNILFVAYIARLYEQKSKISKKQITAVATLGIGLFLLKVAYTPLLLLILALKKATISTRNKWILFCAVFATGAFMYLVWSSNWGSLNAIVDIPSNMNTIIGSPIKSVFAVLVNILFVPMKLFEMNKTLYLGLAIVVATITLMPLIGARAVIPKRLFDLVSQYKLQVLGLMAVIASLVLTYAALMVTWTDVATNGFINILGFQGRYILPLLPLLLLVRFIPVRSRR